MKNWKPYILDLPKDQIPHYVQTCIDASGGDEYIIVGGGGVDICHVGNGPNNREIARLISAAPAMLHALQEMIANCDRWLETGIPADATESKRLYGQMAAAVRKAEGGEG